LHQLAPGSLPLFGRRGIGDAYSATDDDNEIEYRRYGERERIPVSRVIEATADRIDFALNSVSVITAPADNEFAFTPPDGWKYVDLVIPTAELFRLYPSDDPFLDIPPSPMETTDTAPPEAAPHRSARHLPERPLLFLSDVVGRVVACTGADYWEVVPAVHAALCGGDLRAEADGVEIPRSAWFTWSSSDFANRLSGSNDDPGWYDRSGANWHNPYVRTTDVDVWLALSEPIDRPDHQPAANANETVYPSAPPAKSALTPNQQSLADALQDWRTSMPPVSAFLRFGVELTEQIGLENIKAMKKPDLEEVIRMRWDVSALGPISENAVKQMAGMVRPPEARIGGAKPARTSNNGANREGETVSPLHSNF